MTPNLTNVPEWAWIALAIAAMLFLKRNGWLDGLVKRLPVAPKTPSPQPVTPQIVVVEKRAESTGEAATEQEPPASQPMIEHLSLRGPLRITISGGRIDVTS